MAGITSKIVAELEAAFPNLVILTPESSEYEENLLRWNVAAEKKASAVICPLTTEDVSRILAFTHKNSLSIAVCGAGHNHRGNSIENGLVVDLRKMNTVTVDPVSKRVTAQGATTWGTVYEAAEKHGLSAVGGIVNSVGVGGFTLNGGIGWLTSAHGMALDNLLEADVVLADGRVLTCSDDENQELFWAIRGAGSCFGVVTRFVFRAHKVEEKVWTGIFKFDKCYLKDVVGMVNKVMGEENDGTATMGVAFYGDTGEAEINVVPFYNGPQKEAETYFAPLLELEARGSSTRVVPFSQSGLPHGSAPGRQWRKTTAGGGLVVPLDVDFMKSLVDEFEDLITKIPDARSSIFACEMHNPYATMRKSQTSTAYPFRGRHGSIQLMPTWTKQENDAACWAWCRRVDEKISNEFMRRKTESGMDELTRTSSGTYVNYDALHKNPKVLYGVNYERLVKLKRKYDPGNIFREFVDLHSAE